MAVDPGSMEDRIVRILVSFGLDKEGIKQVKDGTLSIDDAISRVKENAASAGSTVPGDVNKIAGSFTALMQAGRLLTSVGRAESVFGHLFKNDDLVRMGSMTRGIGLMVVSIGRLRTIIDQLKKSGGIPSALGIGAAVTGGVLLGAAAYDKLIGPGQQTMNYKTGAMEANTAGNILAQMASTFSYNVTKMVKGGDAANQAFIDTARQYGILKSAEEERADAIKNGIQETGSFTLYLNRLANQINDTSRAMQAAGGLGQVSGAIAGVGGMVMKGIAGLAAQNDPVIKAYNDYQKSITDSEKKYDSERVKINEDALKSMNKATDQYSKENNRAYQDFLKSNAQAAQAYQKSQMKIAQSGMDEEAKAQTAYYDKRAKEAENFGIEIQRLEEDHQVAVQRANQDHTITLRKLAEQRDAGAIEDENQAYELKRSRDEQDYQKEVARKSQDFARSMADEEKQFVAERQARQDDRLKQLAELKQTYLEDAAQRKKDYEDQKKQRASDFADEIDQMQTDATTKLIDLQQAQGEERQTIEDNWTTRRQDLDFYLGNERDQMNNYMKARADDLQAWVNTHLSIPGVTGQPVTVPSSSTSAPYPWSQLHGQQAGGYQPYTGLTLMHQGEFVLNRGATQRMENALGGPLTQNNITNAGADVKIEQYFSGGNFDAAAIKSITYEAVVEAFRKAKQR
jgi:hypothetical protein